MLVYSKPKINRLRRGLRYSKLSLTSLQILLLLKVATNIYPYHRGIAYNHDVVYVIFRFASQSPIAGPNRRHSSVLCRTHICTVVAVVGITGGGGVDRG